MSRTRESCRISTIVSITRINIAHSGGKWYGVDADGSRIVGGVPCDLMTKPTVKPFVVVFISDFFVEV